MNLSLIFNQSGIRVLLTVHNKIPSNPMGLFKRRELKTIDKSSRMVHDYPAFYEYYENYREVMKAVLSQCDNNTIEFRLPVVTFGNIMGQLYLGLSELPDSIYMYTYAISRGGRKTKKFKVPVENILSSDDIEETTQELMSQIIVDPIYRKITTGRL